MVDTAETVTPDACDGNGGFSCRHRRKSAMVSRLTAAWRFSVVERSDCRENTFWEEHRVLALDKPKLGVGRGSFRFGRWFDLCLRGFASDRFFASLRCHLNARDNDSLETPQIRVSLARKRADYSCSQKW